MPESAWLATRTPLLQLALGAFGALTFCIFARCWRDFPHTVYDIPASLAVFSFIAQLLLEVIRDGATLFWGGRFAMLAAMTAVTFGRYFGGWRISGHLSCVLAVALAQSFDTRLGAIERLLYWIPVPIVLAIRLALFDRDGHGETWSSLIFAVAVALPVVLLARWTLR